MGKETPHGTEKQDIATLPTTCKASVSLERELLLMEVKGFKKKRRRRSNSNQLLLIVFFAFALIGSSIYFFQDTRGRWNDQVLTLKGSIQNLKNEKFKSGHLFK